MVTIGKYLSPKLYLSFGQSLFANASEARLRYSISKKWELESKVAGERSGVDLYYKIEFR
jgi:translocation and assembly module TamB